MSVTGGWQANRPTGPKNGGWGGGGGRVSMIYRLFQPNSVTNGAGDPGKGERKGEGVGRWEMDLQTEQQQRSEKES